MPHIPSDVFDTLESLSDRMAVARKVRHLTQADLASIAGISRSTITEIEKGSPYVSIGNYLSVLWALNMLDEIDLIARHEDDLDGQRLLLDSLPKRVKP